MYMCACSIAIAIYTYTQVYIATMKGWDELLHYKNYLVDEA